MKYALDLNQEEREAFAEHLALVNCVTRVPVPIPEELTIREAVDLNATIHLVPKSFTIGSPLDRAFRRVGSIVGHGRMLHRCVHDMLYTMVELGGEWEILDDSEGLWKIGFARADGSDWQCVPLVSLMWDRNKNWQVPQKFKDMMMTMRGRARIAKMVTEGAHELEFPHEVWAPVRRYVDHHRSRS